MLGANGWVLGVILLTLPFLASSQQTPTWRVSFAEAKVNVRMEQTVTSNLSITGLDTSQKTPYALILKSDNPELASSLNVVKSSDISRSGDWKGGFTVNGYFIGSTNLFIQLIKENNDTETSNEKVQVVVLREERVIDHVFTGSVILLVSLLNINFGAAIDLNKMKDILVRPIGPAIGFVGQFLLMPLISFGLGFAVFAHSPELHLGLFFTGVSPGGGASNMWSVILGGNIDLAIIMTTISNIAAFGMMPFWIFTLGKVIFDRAELGVPYSRIGYFAVALLIPLGIGLLIQKYCPRLKNVLVRLLKPISALLILFIIVFAIVTNLYLFKLFSWRIILAGIGLPWLGYCFSWITAKLLKQNKPDALTIAIETGIQNTGISIGLLRFSLPQPAADLTTVIPVAVAIMTPIPLLIIYFWKRIHRNDEERRKMLAPEERDINSD